MPYLDSTEAEKRLGLELFFTDTPGIEGRLKKEPEDFIVTERSINVEPISDAELAKRDKTSPIYVFAKVRVKNWETNRLIKKLAYQLRISHDQVFFAGTKDKRAITTQLMSFGADLESVKAVDLENVELSDIFLSPREFKIGNLLGNNFEINIHEVGLTKRELEDIIASTYEQLKQINGFPNFFGVQRFGIIRPVTNHIGKLLLQHKFEEAVLMYIGHPIKGEPEGDFQARSEFDRCWDYEWAIDNYPKHLVFERTLIRYLLSHPDDYIGALKQFPKNLSMMFIHSYQSLLYNKIVCARIRAGLPLNEPVVGDIILPIDDNKLPIHKTWIPVTEQNQKKLTRQCKKGNAYVSAVLFGHDSKFTEGEFGEIERKIIENEKIERADFIIYESSQLSSKGSRREIVAPIYDFKYEILDDHVKMNFGLIKGSYATTLMREFMKNSIRNY